MGPLVTFEGPEGAGKSTQIALLRRHAEFDEFREPGSTRLGELIRELLLHGDHVAPAAEMYLFMAARAELLARHVEPALAAGRMVVLDRYHDSTIAYQGARGVAVPWPAGFRRPDLTVLIWLDPGTGRERRRLERAQLDRIESEPADFHARVMAGYRRLADLEPARFLVVDGTRPPDAISEEIRARIELLRVAR